MIMTTTNYSKQELVKELGAKDISTWEQVKKDNPELSRNNGDYVSTKEFFDNEIADHEDNPEFVSIDQLPNTQFELLVEDNTANVDNLLTNEASYKVFREIDKNGDPVNDDVIYVACALHLTGDIMYLGNYTKWFFMKFDNDYDDGCSFDQFLSDTVFLHGVNTNIKGVERNFSIDVYGAVLPDGFSIYDCETDNEFNSVDIDLSSKQELLESLFDVLVNEDVLDNSDKQEFMQATID